MLKSPKLTQCYPIAEVIRGVHRGGVPPLKKIFNAFLDELRIQKKMRNGFDPLMEISTFFLNPSLIY